MDATFNTVDNFIARYAAMPEDERHIVTTWILHSWQFSESCPTPNVTPYLYITSAQKGSGKTLLGLDIMEVLARNPVQVAGITGAGLFRIMEQMSPTLLIDEVDTLYSGSKDEVLRGTLNTGYRRGAKYPRVEGREVVMFSTFGAKVLIGIDNNMLPDTVRDRCIPIRMKRATDEERTNIQPFYHYEIEDELEALHEDIHNWSIANGPKIHEYKPKVIPGLSPRQWEISMPLLQVARAAGCEKLIRDALTRILSDVDDERTPEQDMLQTIRDTFDAEDADKLPAAFLLIALAEDPRFAGMSSKALALKMATFGVKATVIRIGNKTHRGYYRRDFEDAWKRYL